MKNLSHKVVYNADRNKLLIFSVIISLVLAIILLSLWLNPVFAEKADEVTINEIRPIKVGNSQYQVSLKYCNYNPEKHPLGAIISSQIGKNIVVLDPDIKEEDCQLYTTRLNAERPSAIGVRLFDASHVDGLISDFEKRLGNLESKRVTAYQDLRVEKALPDIDSKKIERITKNIMKLEQAIQNSKASLRILKTL